MNNKYGLCILRNEYISLAIFMERIGEIILKTITQLSYGFIDNFNKGLHSRIPNIPSWLH